MTTNVHAIIGLGDTTPQAIEESLNDVLNEGDIVAMVWYGPPTETWEAVYDYVLDNEYEFIMYYAEGSNPPRVFREHETGVVQKTRHPEPSAVKEISGNGKLLVLWDNSANEEQFSEGVYDNTPEGTLVLNLANGLVPINIEADPLPEPEEPTFEEDEDDDILAAIGNFSKEELEAAPAAVVKKYGESKNCKAKTKTAIIAELFPEDDDADQGSERALDPVDILNRIEGDLIMLRKLLES